MYDHFLVHYFYNSQKSAKCEIVLLYNKKRNSQQDMNDYIFAKNTFY